MRRKLLMLLACVSVLWAWADLPFRNHRYDSFKVLAPAEGSILFIGNSITDMHCWPEAFVTSEGEYLPIVNRGNSGTYSTEQSDNLESYLQSKPLCHFSFPHTDLGIAAFTHGPQAVKIPAAVCRLFF